MKNYEWIIFDADDTLFHFDAYRGLQLMFSAYNVEFNREHYDEYQIKNKSLWKAYQDGIIPSQELQQERFMAWGEKLQISPKILNSAFLQAMAEICTPLEGAVSLLQSLKGKIKLGIITNGFTELQKIRLANTGLKDHFEFLLVSEEIGIAKPHPAIFEHALTLMGNPDREKVLMVGDTPESDILGGINARIDTCWLNASNRISPQHITAKYQVSSLHELEGMLQAVN